MTLNSSLPALPWLSDSEGGSGFFGVFLAFDRLDLLHGFFSAFSSAFFFCFPFFSFLFLSGSSFLLAFASSSSFFFSFSISNERDSALVRTLAVDFPLGFTGSLG